MQMPRILRTGLEESMQMSTVVERDSEYYAKHFVLEAMASVLVTYSAFYVPDSESDFLKQYVGSICVFAIIMTLKDSDYFFPDATPITTTVLCAATLYTSENGSTNWTEIFSRVSGQLAGYALVFWLVTMEPLSESESGPATYVSSINEGIGTMIEGIAIAFATIPLLTPYDNGNGLRSKAEAAPPSNRSLSLVALSLSVIHYTLERLFRATMNPLVTILRCYLDGSNAVFVVFCQLAGLFAAFLYVSWCVPSRETLQKLRKSA